MAITAALGEENLQGKQLSRDMLQLQPKMACVPLHRLCDV